MEILVENEPLIIVDSDDIDTLDTLLSNNHSSDEEAFQNSSENHIEGKYDSLEKISLENIPYLIFNDNEDIFNECIVYDTEDDADDFVDDTKNDNILNIENEEVSFNNYDNSFKDTDTQDCLNNINLEYEETLKNELLEPLELLSKLEDLRIQSRQTVKKLRELKTTCEQAIIDIEHKIEFEDFTVSEGYKYAMIIKNLRIKRRFIKNTLDKYDSVSLTLDTLDKSLGKNFIKSQIKTIKKVSKIQSCRQYTPRVLKKLEITGKTNMDNTLEGLEIQIESILKNANM